MMSARQPCERKFSENFAFLELSILECPFTESKTRPRAKNNRNLNVDDIHFDKPITMEKFKQMLPTIGQFVRNVRIVNGNSVILPSIEKYCKNLKQLELLDGDGSGWLENFRNLTEMKLPKIRIPTHSFRKCLMNNPDLESLEFDHFWYEGDVSDLLELLPKLMSLRLVNLAIDGSTVGKKPKRPIPFDYSGVTKILEPDMLTKLSFESERNCNELLDDLARLNNIQELAIKMIVTNTTFPLIGKLKNLTILAITAKSPMRYIGKRHSTWPPLLTDLTLNNITISANDLLSIIDELKCLEQLNIDATNGQPQSWLRDKKTIAEIEKIVETRRWTFQIFFSDAGDKSPYMYKSDHLEIINECAANTEVRPLQVLIVG